jgi:predicted O-linked N-acetylglucosamine transferase (SPINDLY family)
MAEAVPLYQQAIKDKPSSPDTYHSFALALAQGGHPDKAIPLFKQAQKMAPTDVQLLFNLGFTYSQMRKLKKALKCFNKVIKLSPTTREAYLKAASVLRDMGRLPELVNMLEMAIKLDPQNPNAYGYLGETLNNMKRWDEAVALYERFLKMPAPKGMPAAMAVQAKADTHQKMADSLSNLQKHVQSIEHYKHALKLAPGLAESLAGLWHVQGSLSLWDEQEEVVQRVMRAVHHTVHVEKRPSPLSPYQCLFLPVAGSEHLAITQSWETGLLNQYGQLTLPDHSQALQLGSAGTQGKGGLLGWSAAAAGAGGGGGGRRRLRLGFISRRFEHYPGTQLMLRTFALYDRQRFEVFVYAHGPDDQSAERRTVAATCDSFKDVSALAPDAVAAQITKDGVDVLIDYDGGRLAH